MIFFIPGAAIEKVKNENIETNIVISKDIPVILNAGDIIVMNIPEDEEIIENVPFTMIQNAPVFKGCEGLSKEENKVCFGKQMKRFVQRNFDADMANDLGLNAGRYKIRTQFLIDEKGNVVDIKIRAPHARLEKETERLLKKLPKFTPGQQQNRFVKVRDPLPIAFGAAQKFEPLRFCYFCNMRIRQYLDATYLKTATQADITEKENLQKIVVLTEEAISYYYKLVMIREKYIPVVKKMLVAAKSAVLIGTVIDFPEGKSTIEEKLKEAQRAIDAGADLYLIKN